MQLLILFTTARATTTNKDEYSVEEMRLLASFAHHCPLNSKEKLIEELRNTNVDIFSSRAKAIRMLDSIATKKKHPSGAGVYWEVSKDVLLELGLNEILVSIATSNLLCGLRILNFVFTLVEETREF